MLWIKALHVAFMVTWFAGLFYLPRLFVYHATATDKLSVDRFVVMERRLFAIMTIGAVLTAIFGLWMLFDYAWIAAKGSGWLHAKLFLVILLITYHVYCYKIVKVFARGTNTRSERFYRLFNEFPVLLLFAIIIMVIVRPF